jgi:hypothetical protein
MSYATLATLTAGWLDEIKSEPKIHRFEDDPVALSCAVFREWRSNHLARFLDLTAATALPEDHATAAQIRDYYGKKFSYQLLKGHTLSPFRQTLVGLMAETHHVEQSQMGMLYRLPGFYHEDQETDHMFEHVTPGVEQVYKEQMYKEQMKAAPYGWGPQQRHFSLTPLRKIHRDAKPKERTRFWYLTQQGFALCVTVANDNSMFQLFNSLYERGPVELAGHVRLKTGFAPEQSYLELLQPVLV